uniref:CASP-like protein n=1 Tax=Musa acuminata subsp. malaccensis TaxID=214687 RepID=A0A804L067_MUSAM
MATESSRSPLRKADGSLPPSPLNSIPDHSTSPPSSAVFGRNDLSVVMAMAESWSGQREPEPAGSRVVSGILHRDRREEAVRRTAVVARLAAAALCLVAFSVLAADRDKGWALDSYNRYKQFRYGSAQDFSFDCHSRIGSLSVVERARHIGASKVPNNDI